MAKLKEMKGCSGVAILLAIFLAQVLISCTDMSPNPRSEEVLPALLEVSRNAGDTDAVAEVLITTAILAEREQGYYGKGIEWLLAQQREDGTYRDARTTRENMPPTHFRHGILVVSWALLESLQ